MSINPFGNGQYTGVTGQQLLDRLMAVKDLKDPPSLEEEYPKCKGLFAPRPSFTGLVEVCKVMMNNVVYNGLVEEVEGLVEERIHYRWMQEGEDI